MSGPVSFATLTTTLPTSDERCAALAQAYPQQPVPAEHPVDGAAHDSDPSDREARAENGTVPGVGVPMVLISGKLAAERVDQYLPATGAVR